MAVAIGRGGADVNNDHYDRQPVIVIDTQQLGSGFSED
ncbi:unnamed protein product [Mycena citricolor]|uniref:Uncharacterized protein n=1 Tax=Mycena citricolor TaxID=2018698 RepID=A0AAD2JUE7_9AGAR|nr:unnamed protein product [Mycena citricolor]